MHADVERFSFDPTKRFLRVLQQQGRVALAADGNEQVAILLEYLRDLAVDVIGPFGTPADESNTKPGPGFLIGRSADGSPTIGPGRFWVDGLLCENRTAGLAYTGQLDFPMAPRAPQGRVVFYLDAWERHVAAAQDDSIRDVALGGPDTCSRSRLVWQVNAAPVGDAHAMPSASQALELWSSTWRPAIQPPDRGLLAATVAAGSAPEDPRQVPAGYLGNDNRLYRVEIHRGSTPPVDGVAQPPTFTWSRGNGSVIHPLGGIEGTVAVLRDPPIDNREQFTTGVLVEVVDDVSSLLGRPGPLGRVVDVDDDSDAVVIHLSAGPPADIPRDRHPLLRRWDHPNLNGGAELPEEADDGALVIREGNDTWVTLEDGVRIRFAPPPAGRTHMYRTGDYWTFPARAATGDVAWPKDGAGLPEAVPPHGIDHHLAPLAVATIDAKGRVMGAPVDCRLGFPRLATLLP